MEEGARETVWGWRKVPGRRSGAGGRCQVPVCRSSKGSMMDQVLGRSVFLPEEGEADWQPVLEGFFDSDRDTVFLHLK